MKHFHPLSLFFSVTLLLSACGKTDKAPPSPVVEAKDTATIGPHIWTPDEVNDSIEFHRAVNLLAPGDVFRLGPGTYATFSLPAGVSVLGAGIDETIIALEHRGPRFDARDYQATFADLTLRRVSEEAPEGDYYVALSLSGNWTVRNVRVGPFPGSGVSLQEGTFTVENLSIIDCPIRCGLRTENFHPDSVVDGLTVSGMEEGFDLELAYNSGGTFRNLDLSGDGDGAITIGGWASCPIFEGVDSFILNDILYEEGAEPRAEVAAEDIERLRKLLAPPVYDPEDPWAVDQNMLRARAFDDHQRAQRIPRIEFARAYYAALEADPSEPAVTTALRTYLEQLVATYSDEHYDPGVDGEASVELAWFGKTFGPEAALAVIDGLPQPGHRDPEDDYYFDSFDEATQTAVRELRIAAENAQRATAADEAFAAYYTALKNSESPEAMGEAFLAGTQSYFDALKQQFDVYQLNFEPYLEPVLAAFKRAADSNDAETLAAILVRFPATETRDLPSRRVLLRELSSEARRAVMPLLRGK